MSSRWGTLAVCLATGAGAVPAAAESVSAPAEAKAAPGRTRLAIVVGHNGSQTPGRAELRFADDDAARYFELLAPAMDRAWLLTGFDDLSQEVFAELVPIARTPTRIALEAVLLEAEVVLKAARERGDRTELIFVYAGHGDVSDGMGFVNLEEGRLTRVDFEDLVLDGLPTDRKHVIIDACRSYFLVSSRGPGGTRQVAPQSYAGPRRRAGVGFVLSTSSDAESHEWASFQGGVFSHEIRSALSGGADLDLDGAVDYQELAAFVAVANEGIPQARYRPRFFIQPPSEDKAVPVFAPADTGVRWLELPERVEGRVRVTDHRGVPYADLNKAAGDVLRIALVGVGDHTVAWGDRRWRMDGALPRAELTSLPEAPGEVAARTQPHEAFRHLFSTPMSAEVLRGWRLGARLTKSAPEPPPRRLRWLPPTMVGMGLALAGGGAAMLVAGAQSRSDLADSSLSQADLASRADEGDTLVAAGIVTAATGLVLGTIGGLIWKRY
ncbi:MAG: caspase family protein [Myxococcota bacterium]